MSNGTPNIEEHENVRYDNNKCILTTLFGDVVRNRSLCQVVRFQSNETGIFSFDLVDLVNEVLIVVKAIGKICMVILTHSFIERFNVSDKHILLPSFSICLAVIVVVQ